MEYGFDDRPDMDDMVLDNTELDGEEFGDELDPETMDYILQRAEMMGCDTSNPEMMAGWLKRLARKIRDRVRARRRRRAESKARSEAPAAPIAPFTIQTPRGGFSMGPSGVNVFRPGQPGAPGQYPLATQASANPLQAMFKNPMMLAIPLGLVAVLALMKKK